MTAPIILLVFLLVISIILILILCHDVIFDVLVNNNGFVIDSVKILEELDITEVVFFDILFSFLLKNHQFLDQISLTETTLVVPMVALFKDRMVAFKVLMVAFFKDLMVAFKNLMVAFFKE